MQKMPKSKTLTIKVQIRANEPLTKRALKKIEAGIRRRIAIPGRSIYWYEGGVENWVSVKPIK